MANHNVRPGPLRAIVEGADHAATNLILNLILSPGARAEFVVEKVVVHISEKFFHQPALDKPGQRDAFQPFVSFRKRRRVLVIDERVKTQLGGQGIDGLFFFAADILTPGHIDVLALPLGNRLIALQVVGAFKGAIL